MSVEFGRVYDYPGLRLSVRLTHAGLDEQEPAVQFLRDKKSAFICLSAAHDYVDSRDLIIRVTSMGRHLGFNMRHEFYKLADIILDHLTDLVRSPPAQEETKQEFQNNLDYEVERNKLDIRLDGESLIK